MNYINEKLQEFEDYIYQKKVAIIGLGVSNIPLIDYLYEKKSKVTVFDDRTIDELPKEIADKLTSYSIPHFLGENNLKNLNGFDLIFRSPSCLPTKAELRAEEERGAIVTTEIEMLMKMCPCKIIGVTGSEGKTTTTSLIYAILKHAGYNTYLGGNIGMPLFTKLSEMVPEDIVVLELSSFQLRRHILNTKEIKLRGRHNFENICSALAATKEFVSEDTAVEAIKEFNAVEHRLEFVRNINGVKWYNDSASSSPSRTIAGLNAYDEEIVLIAGGYDKNLDYEILGKYIVKKVKALILIGNTAKKILTATMQEMEKEKIEIPICCAKTLEEAVEAAKHIAQKEQVVLFSPASASFDMFKNFADRGNQFKELVNKI